MGYLRILSIAAACGEKINGLRHGELKRVRGRKLSQLLYIAATRLN